MNTSFASLTAAASALVLALTLSVATLTSAQAAEANAFMSGTQTPPAEEVAQLRHLLTQPHLTLDDQRLLEKTLEDISEEMADASEPAKQPKGLVETVNDLLGVKSPTTTAQG